MRCPMSSSHQRAFLRPSNGPKAVHKSPWYWAFLQSKEIIKVTYRYCFLGAFFIFFGLFDLKMVQRPFTSIHSTGHSCSQKRSSKLLKGIDKKKYCPLMVLILGTCSIGSQHVKTCLNLSKRPSNGPNAMHTSPRYCCSQKRNWCLHINIYIIHTV